MPCNSSHLEPSEREQESVRVIQLLCYVYDSLSKKKPKWLAALVGRTYGDVDNLDDHTRMLCELCWGMSPRTQDEIMYNGRIKKARMLADWWETHQKADLLRWQQEQEEKERQKLIDLVRTKLTKKELQAILEEK